MGTILLILASALWGFVHSLTASLKTKEAVHRTFGLSAMNWYRLSYNVFSIISFLPLFILAVVLPDRLLYVIPDPWADITTILRLMAVVVLFVGVFQTDVWSFLGLRQITGGQSESTMVTSGLYRFVRHPLYSAGLVFIWLTPEMSINMLVLYLSLTVYIIIGAYFEERKLVREFGKSYEDYQNKTPMLVPVIIRRK
jgi:methanethiol S-methyltransferase